MQNVGLPNEYTNSVSEKQSAAEDITLAQSQRTQETTKATTLLLAAREEAWGLILRACTLCWETRQEMDCARF